MIQRYFFLFFNKNICCDPSLEPSQRDGSNDGVTTSVLLENYKKLSQNYLCCCFVSWREVLMLGHNICFNTEIWEIIWRTAYDYKFIRGRQHFSLPA